MRKMNQMVLATPRNEDSLRDEPTNQEVRSRGWVNRDGLSTVSPAVDHGQNQYWQQSRLHWQIRVFVFIFYPRCPKFTSSDIGII